MGNGAGLADRRSGGSVGGDHDIGTGADYVNCVLVVAANDWEKVGSNGGGNCVRAVTNQVALSGAFANVEYAVLAGSQLAGD